MKRLQKRIAEGGSTLLAAAVFALLVWLQAGLVTQQLWMQLLLFVASVYLLIELSNQNALLRVRSRMVSTTFIMLSCTACFLFPELRGGIVQLCFVASYLMLFQTYQDRQSVRPAYYAFVCLSMASLPFVQVLWYVPLIWVMMGVQLQSLSWRTWLASLLGLLTPYWFAMLWLIYLSDFTPALDHFSQLACFSMSPQMPSTGIVLAVCFTAIMSAIGIVHFWSYSFEDKIRIRLLYGLFTTMTIVTLLLILLQPQHHAVLMRIAIVNASPLIAHVLTFTNSRLSNWLFFLAAGIAVGITAYNLWMPS